MELKNEMAVKPTEQVKLFERVAYGLGDFGCNIIYTAMTTYLLFYYIRGGMVEFVSVALFYYFVSFLMY